MGIGCYSINAVIFVWLMYIEPIRTGRRPLLDPESPHMFATLIFGLIGSLCLVKGLWPVYGLLTPIIFVVVFLGVLMTLLFLVPFIFDFRQSDPMHQD